MAPRPEAMWGTRAPTAKKRVATAMPNWPVTLSRAMIDQVMSCPSASRLASCRVALHATRIGGRAASRADARGRGEAALRPVGADFHDMPALAQIVDRRLGHAVFDHEHARACRAWPERDREMLGVPSRRVDRLLQVQLAVDMSEEELRHP